MNIGSWKVRLFGADEAQLFSQLSGGVLRTVTKIGTVPPLTIMVGGGTQQYVLQYVSGETVEVITNVGNLYNKPELLTDPVDSYVAKVALPTGVEERFKP